MGSKLTLEKVIERCRNLGVEFLDSEYISVKHKHRFSCKDCQTEFISNLNSVTSGKRLYCKECGLKKKSNSRLQSIEDIKLFCESVGSEFLSNEFNGNKYKYLFKCKYCGKTFSTKYGNFKHKNKRHCNECIHKSLGTQAYDNILKYCKDNGFELLDDFYYGHNHYHNYRCKICGKSHKARLIELKRRFDFNCSRCGYDRKNRKKMKSLDEVELICKSKGSEFMDGVYLGIFSKHNFKCVDCGETFLTTLNSFIYSGTTTCRACNGRKDWSIESVRCWVLENRPDYEFVSESYISRKHKYRFKYIGDQDLIGVDDMYFETTWESFLIGTRHPSFKLSYGAHKIYKFLNEFNINFKMEKTYPDLLGINKTKLRFDFYLQSQNILIEYDGKQHFDSTFYSVPMSEYMKRKKYDLKKNKYCRDNNIRLIRIPYYEQHQINKILKYALGL